MENFLKQWTCLVECLKLQYETNIHFTTYQWSSSPNNMWRCMQVCRWCNLYKYRIDSEVLNNRWILQNIDSVQINCQRMKKNQIFTFSTNIIAAKGSIQFLGIRFQQHKMNKLKYLLKKLLTVVFTVWRMMDLANKKTAIAAYFSLFHSIISYCIIISGNTSHFYS